MYIISKHTDFYDSVGSQYGIDKSIIYKRERIELLENKGGFFGPIKKVLTGYGTHLDFPNHAILKAAPGNPKSTLNVRKYWYGIGFCGKFYVCLKIVVEKGTPAQTPYGFAEDKEYFLYSDQFLPIMEDEVKNTPQPKKYAWRWSAPTNYNHVINNIKALENLDYSSVFYDRKVPAFMFLIEGNSRLNDNQYNYNPVLNPILKDYLFFKVKNSFTAFQEIQQYISGVIGIGNNEPIVTDDKYKIIAAGFDVKTSFRKDSGKPRPRKQK